MAELIFVASKSVPSKRKREIGWSKGSEEVEKGGKILDGKTNTDMEGELRDCTAFQ